MKNLYFISIFLIVFALEIYAEKKGKCKTDKDCESVNGRCISVNNDISGIEDAAQCVTGKSVCSGRDIGSCPHFNDWGKNFESLKVLCAFYKPSNCREPEDPKKDDDGKVDCYEFRYKDGSKTKKELGIYQCMDAEYYKKHRLYSEKVTEKQIDECEGKKSSSKLCNGHGSCEPKRRFDDEYKCKCFKGYEDSEKNCYKPTSNKCDNIDQCGALGKCNTKTQECECPAGTTGYQCAKCVDNHKDSCSGNGECSNGKCTCKEGYSGEFCNKGGLLSDDPSKPNSTSIRSFSLGLIIGCILFIWN